MSVRLSSSYIFLVDTHSYVLQATHAFLEMMPLCFKSYFTLIYQRLSPALYVVFFFLYLVEQNWSFLRIAHHVCLSVVNLTTQGQTIICLFKLSRPALIFNTPPTSKSLKKKSWETQEGNVVSKCIYIRI